MSALLVMDAENSQQKCYLYNQTNNKPQNQTITSYWAVQWLYHNSPDKYEWHSSILYHPDVGF